MPLIKSFKSLNIPICMTKECASNFSLLLMNEKTYNSFNEFLKKYMPDGSKFLTLYTELNVFKHNQNHDNKILSSDIYETYLNHNSKMYIDFPPYLIDKIHIGYKTSNKNSYDSVFDSLGEYCYNILKDYYYPNFKLSNEYNTLETELEKDEIIYSRLVASCMISSFEID